MTENKASELLMILKDKLPDDKLLIVKGKLLAASDDKYAEVLNTKFFAPLDILLFSIFTGFLGVDRFVLGDIAVGIGKLLVGWLTFGIWYLIDIFFSHKRARELNYQTLSLIL